MKEISMRNFDYITNPAKLLTPDANSASSDHGFR